MLRFVLLMPLVILGLLAFEAHQASENVEVSATHPSDDPRFSAFSGMSYFDMLMIDTDLANAYNRASMDYSRAEDDARRQISEFTETRDNFIFGAALVVFFFLISLFPWRKWSRATADGVSNDVAKLGNVVGDILPKVAPKDRTIIGREGLDNFSVSAELLNWQKLLEEGVVTQEEFDKARSKLLGRPTS